jgi:hypothetical protein
MLPFDTVFGNFSSYSHFSSSLKHVSSLRGCLHLAGALVVLVLISSGPVLAETCRKQVVDGQEVVICCDGNGVCYSK